jgi:hypothetical protein
VSADLVKISVGCDLCLIKADVGDPHTLFLKKLAIIFYTVFGISRPLALA